MTRSQGKVWEKVNRERERRRRLNEEIRWASGRSISCSY